MVKHLLVLVMLCVWLPLDAGASCLSDAYKACRAEHKASRTKCKAARKALLPGCKLRRKESISQCKQHKASVACKRQKMTPSDKEACRARKVKALKQCTKPNENPACERGLQACSKQCFRSCTICTAKGVAPCIALCKDQKQACLDRLTDRYIVCRRRAKALERSCVRDFSITQWGKYYNCARSRMLRYMRCQHRSYDGQRSCYFRASDAYRQCVRKASRAKTTCLRAAKRRCRS